MKSGESRISSIKNLRFEEEDREREWKADGMKRSEENIVIYKETLLHLFQEHGEDRCIDRIIRVIWDRYRKLSVEAHEVH